jgi:hypothetical protein
MPHLSIQRFIFAWIQAGAHIWPLRTAVYGRGAALAFLVALTFRMALDPFKKIFVVPVFFDSVYVLVHIVSFRHCHHMGYEDEVEKTALRFPRPAKNISSLGSIN